MNVIPQKKPLLSTWAIYTPGNFISETQLESLIYSSEEVHHNPFEIHPFESVTPLTINDVMLREGLHWNYPWFQEEYVEDLKVFKRPYKTKNQEAKIACALSHYLLWKKAAVERQPILILEHDATFIEQLDNDDIKRILASDKLFIGINDPRRATRRAADFHKSIQSNKAEIQECPWVEKSFSVIQGLAGGSAYILKPKGASLLLDSVNRYGLWINDAQICHQMFPKSLGVTRQYFTKIQDQAISTTT